MAVVIDKLSVDQVRAFDKEYVTDHRWTPIELCVNQNFPSGKFSFLDLGGGNGVFADRVLRSYPKAEGMVIDSSEHLIQRNVKSLRKTVMLGDAGNIASYDLPKFDVIFCNWLLHHLVSGGDYSNTRANIASVLESCRSMLTERGALSVYENDCDGKIVDNYPSHAVFFLTSSRLLAPIMRRLGANTAGVGVCFLSHRTWCSVFRRCGFVVAQHTSDQPWSRRGIRDLPLQIKKIAAAHYWLNQSS